MIVGIPRAKDNIKYYVDPLPKLAKLSEFFSEHLLSKRQCFPKTIVFCRTIGKCVSLYRGIESIMGNNFTNSPCNPNYHQLRLVDMYTRACSNDMRKKVLESFMIAGG